MADPPPASLDSAFTSSASSFASSSVSADAFSYDVERRGSYPVEQAPPSPSSPSPMLSPGGGGGGGGHNKEDVSIVDDSSNADDAAYDNVVVENYKAGFCTMLSLFLMSATLPTLFLLGFSSMGYGLEVVVNSYNYHDEITKVVIITVIFMVFMYIFDSHYWPIPLRVVAWFSVFAAFSVSMCLMVAEVPFGPICIFTVLMPLHLLGIKRLFYPSVPSNVYAGWIYVVCVQIAGMILVGWFVWLGQDGYMWNSMTRAEYSNAAGCEVDFTDLENCESGDVEGVPCFWDANYTNITFNGTCTTHCLGVYQACEEAFIMWAAPGLAAMALIVIGFISKFLQQPDDPHAKEQISAVFKVGLVFLFLFWIFASLAGAGEGLSSSLIAFAISMAIGASIVFSAVFWTSITSRSSNEIAAGAAKSAAKTAGGYIDMLRGLLILMLGPLLVVYLLISVVNQFFRRFMMRHCCRRRVPSAEYEHRGWVTLAVASQIEDFKGWDHAKVLSYAVYWGVGYVLLSVIASKFTTVFLSWLIESTSHMGLASVTLIVIGVGMVLFMLPPVPGLPIYLTGGIVLVSVGSDVLGGVWFAILYACVVSLFLKLLACTVQQKLIGGALGGSVGVKQMVSINSEGIRAMRVMLSDRGITGRKVAVLVGGPDWPVSVLCGILGLDLFPILVGTLPVVILVVPTVLCGSFAYMGSLEDENGMDLYPWADTMGAVASAVAVAAMMYFSLSAAGAVKDTLTNEKAVIDAIPVDEPVREADEVAERNVAAYRRVTVWSIVPVGMKAVLVAAVLCMMGCVYLLVVFGAKCFKEYDLMYTIKEHLGGNWTNIVQPLGRLALLLFFVSYGLLYVFEFWAKAKSKASFKATNEAEAEAMKLTSAKVMA